jgi:hypothetical protein
MGVSFDFHVKACGHIEWLFDPGDVKESAQFFAMAPSQAAQ